LSLAGEQRALHPQTPTAVGTGGPIPAIGRPAGTGPCSRAAVADTAAGAAARVVHALRAIWPGFIGTAIPAAQAGAAVRVGARRDAQDSPTVARRLGIAPAVQTAAISLAGRVVECFAGSALAMFPLATGRTRPGLGGPQLGKRSRHEGRAAEPTGKGSARVPTNHGARESIEVRAVHWGSPREHVVRRHPRGHPGVAAAGAT
jgi:hypothetical protein